MATKVLPTEAPYLTTGGQTAVVNDKGQIVIPAEMRKTVGVTPGTRVVFWVENSRIVLQPIEKFVEELPGMFGAGASLEDIRDKDHRNDKER